jgi:hypothetical protein
MNMKCFKRSRLPAAAIGLIAALAAMPRPAHSHHSFAMYDQSIEKTFTGRLTRFIPGGNHAQLIFEVLGENGETMTTEDGKALIWGVETGPAATIAREGITVKSFPLGTILTVTLNPLRDGRNFGSLARGSAIIKCGSEFPEGGCNAETGESFLGSRE